MSASQRTPRPEWRPNCLRDLYEILGYSDSTVEWVEIAVRHLRKEHGDGGDIRLAELAAIYGVRVNPIDMDGVALRWATLQVITVHQHVEWFLGAFRCEHPRHVRGRKAGEDLLSYTIDAFGLSHSDVGILEFGILDYYRRTRNQLLHSDSGKQKKVHRTQLEHIRESIKSSKFAKLDAPNTLDALKFDDFILFSRAAKDVARRLCAGAEPTAAELFEVLRNNRELLVALRSVKQNSRRVHGKLALYLRTEYAFAATAEMLSQNILALGLLAQSAERPPS